MHKGIVIKFNTNQRYATNAWTTSVLREIASRVDVPLQVKICFFQNNLSKSRYLLALTALFLVIGIR